jgi:hypothetical protein
MIPDLLSHEARPIVFLDQADVVDVALLLVMNDDVIMNRRGFASQLDIYQDTLMIDTKGSTT